MTLTFMTLTFFEAVTFTTFLMATTFTMTFDVGPTLTLVGAGVPRLTESSATLVVVKVTRSAPPHGYDFTPHPAHTPPLSLPSPSLTVSAGVTLTPLLNSFFSSPYATLNPVMTATLFPLETLTAPATLTLP